MNSTDDQKPEEAGIIHDTFDFEDLPESAGSLPGGQEGGLRLQVFLAHAGVASRRAAEEIIAEGRVRVNGKVVRERGYRVGKADEVMLDGRKIHQVNQKIYLILNKPEQYVCSAQDPEGRALAQDLLVSYRDVRLFSVGRLDYMSSGLIIFTNDGDFSNRVAHPRNEIEKEYEIETRKELTDEFLEEFKKGIFFEGERYRIKSYRRTGPRKALLVLTEGKNREIRNACAARKINIRKLHRVRIGMVRLGTLKTGAYRLLTPDEVEWLSGQGKKKHGRGN